MKKAIAFGLSLALALPAAGVLASSETDFETLSRLEWSFSSGAGGWSTDMRMEADGSFSGEFHDSEMGESAGDYPEGTVYFCAFTGRMSFAEKDGNPARLRVDSLTVAEGEAESIEDGVRYVAAAPYGLSEGDEMLLYSPGTPVSALPEEMLLWAHVLDAENPPEKLEYWFLSSSVNDSGFVGWEPVGAMLPNPWLDMTAEQLEEASGVTFGVPEGAENLVWRFLPGEGLAEMQFVLDGCECCARIRPAALEMGEMMDISGMNYAWAETVPVTVGRCEGLAMRTAAGAEEGVGLCLWYDAAPGLMYSLSVRAPGPDAPDPAALAEQVFVPMQGEA